MGSTTARWCCALSNEAKSSGALAATQPHPPHCSYRAWQACEYSSTRGYAEKEISGQGHLHAEITLQVGVEGTPLADSHRQILKRLGLDIIGHLLRVIPALMRYPEPPVLIALPHERQRWLFCGSVRVHDCCIHRYHHIFEMRCVLLQ